MAFWELMAIAVGLSMDAFAVSLGKGLHMPRLNQKKLLVIALLFGLFQAGMPVIGWFLGSRFASYIENFDHWVAFGLLLIIGINMIREAILDKDQEPSEQDDSLEIRNLLLLSVATSIDALAVGISFGVLGADIVFSAAVIGLVTFLISACGVWIGHSFGVRFKSKAEIIGGVILILVGVKILLEHLFG